MVVLNGFNQHKWGPSLGIYNGNGTSLEYLDVMDVIRVYWEYHGDIYTICLHHRENNGHAGHGAHGGHGNGKIQG